MGSYLECGHCGDVAIEFPESGLLGQDDGEKCMMCGWPGHVDIDDQDESCPTASWTCAEPEGFDGYCNQDDCGECRTAELKCLRASNAELARCLSYVRCDCGDLYGNKPSACLLADHIEAYAALKGEKG